MVFVTTSLTPYKLSKLHVAGRTGNFISVLTETKQWACAPRRFLWSYSSVIYKALFTSQVFRQTFGQHMYSNAETCGEQPPLCMYEDIPYSLHTCLWWKELSVFLLQCCIKELYSFNKVITALVESSALPDRCFLDQPGYDNTPFSAAAKQKQVQFL